jgi:hypothetical protein
MKNNDPMEKKILNEVEKLIKKMIPSDPTFAHYKKQCICCEKSGKRMNKEHIFPQWLLKKTNNMGNLLKTLHGDIPGKSFTIPLCEDCNSLLSEKLEAPVSLIFDNIENGKGFNDFEAEKIIQWMWKINGMAFWSVCNKGLTYGIDTLLTRVTEPICYPRSRISIAIGLIKNEFEDSVFSPVGIDSECFYSNVYVAGVFSKLSIIVFYSEFESLIDDFFWTVYTLSDYPIMTNPNNKIFPKISFRNGSEGICITKLLAGKNSKLETEHEKMAKKQIFNILYNARRIELLDKKEKDQ